MHRAPAVNFSVKRSRWQAWVIVCLTLLALATLAIFSWQQAANDQRAVGLVWVILIASGTAFMGWKRSPQGYLRWDGLHWYWSGYADGPVCSLRLSMDFQNFVVVHISATGHSPLSLWLEASPGDANWKPLRRAIVSSQAPSDGTSKKNGPGVLGDPA